MRTLQLIDALDAGGAERMAVNYANALLGKVAFSGLVATRKEGPLKDQLEPGVSYLYLNKEKTLDLNAIARLREFVQLHQVSIVHAHGTTFFIAILLKFVVPRLKIVWHDHNGARSNQKKGHNKVLIFCSYFFSSIIVVNQQLEEWATRNLFTRKIIYLPNFTLPNPNEEKQTILKGQTEKRIVCLSNLRHPKNHLTLTKAFSNTGLAKKGWTLHFVGKDYKDEYANTLKECIFELQVEQYVFLYDSCSDVDFILSQAEIGVLASYYEGFPVTLLEYGIAGLAVISTNVGYCGSIIQHNTNGLLFDPTVIGELEQHFLSLCNDATWRYALGQQLKKDVAELYSTDVLITKVLQHYQSL
ncbi:glycosyltransferase [Flavobacterium soli]|uniref:glycosyltransferase n=1 Tax=Flavobacterium soli TaxID=344881 RepID=UPI0003FE02B6|nr:glycosyltransferase [Flavobacterium soli]